MRVLNDSMLEPVKPKPKELPSSPQSQGVDQHGESSQQESAPPAPWQKENVVSGESAPASSVEGSQYKTSSSIDWRDRVIAKQKAALEKIQNNFPQLLEPFIPDEPDTKIRKDALRSSLDKQRQEEEAVKTKMSTSSKPGSEGSDRNGKQTFPRKDIKNQKDNIPQRRSERLAKMKENQPQTKHDGNEQIEDKIEEREREQMEVEPEDGKE